MRMPVTEVETSLRRYKIRFSKKKIHIIAFFYLVKIHKHTDISFGS